MIKAKIRKGDTVEIISGAGEDKGKKGEVIKVLPGEGHVVVQGVALRTKHQRQVQSQGRTVNPGKVQFESEIDISNVMLICPKCNKKTRIGFQRDDAKVYRVCKKCNATIDE